MAHCSGKDYEAQFNMSVIAGVENVFVKWKSYDKRTAHLKLLGRMLFRTVSHAFSMIGIHLRRPQLTGINAIDLLR